MCLIKTVYSGNHSFLHNLRDYTDGSYEDEDHGNRPKVLVRNSSSASSDDPNSAVSRIQNATQNVMGRITGIGRGVGGLANKFSGNFLNF
ncbi:Uncharacterised protein r2_g1610 [Pycnogonum litorale]